MTTNRTIRHRAAAILLSGGLAAAVFAAPALALPSRPAAPGQEGGSSQLKAEYDEVIGEDFEYRQRQPIEDPAAAKKTALEVMETAIDRAVANQGALGMYCRVAPATIYRLAQKGQIPCGKVGRSWRFHREAIDRWIAAHPTFAQERSGSTADD